MDVAEPVSPTTMGRAIYNGDDKLTLLKLVLQLHDEFIRSLEPIRVTPLQAGVLLFLRRHAEARVSDAATALRVRLPTVSEVVKDLVRKRWVTKRPRSQISVSFICGSVGGGRLSPGRSISRFDE